VAESPLLLGPPLRIYFFTVDEDLNTPFPLQKPRRRVYFLSDHHAISEGDQFPLSLLVLPVIFCSSSASSSTFITPLLPHLESIRCLLPILLLPSAYLLSSRVSFFQLPPPLPFYLLLLLCALASCLSTTPLFLPLMT